MRLCQRALPCSANWRRRGHDYLRYGVGAIYDQPRSGRLSVFPHLDRALIERVACTAPEAYELGR